MGESDICTIYVYVYFLNSPFFDRADAACCLTDSWPEAMAIQARPSEMAYAARNYWSVAETIYKHSGNLSSDLTWYAKHAAIMAAYCSSELYMVQDCSPGYFDTWSFLKRRLDDGRTLWA